MDVHLMGVDQIADALGDAYEMPKPWGTMIYQWVRCIRR
jgi:hypothetical protein